MLALAWPLDEFDTVLIIAGVMLFIFILTMSWRL